MQKGVFLLAQRGSPAWRTLYDYEPYDWGPYSRPLARDLETLLGQRQLILEPVPGNRYNTYNVTPSGERAADNIWAGLNEAERQFVRAVREYVTSRSFSDLLREVYAAYPAYATKSRFAG